MRRVVVFLAVLALLTGCGTSLSDSISETTWASYGGMLVAFHADGTYSVGNSVPEDVSQAGTEWGTWSLDGDSLTMVPDAESPNCAEIPGTYTLELVDDGSRLEVTAVDDECNARQADFGFGLRAPSDTDS